jgi:hypothetical protein
MIHITQLVLVIMFFRNYYISNHLHDKTIQTQVQWFKTFYG